jgi:hypothetical protein
MGSMMYLSYVYISENMRRVGRVSECIFFILLVIVKSSAKFHFNFTDLFILCCQKCLIHHVEIL